MLSVYTFFCALFITIGLLFSMGVLIIYFTGHFDFFLYIFKLFCDVCTGNVYIEETTFVEEDVIREAFLDAMEDLQKEIDELENAEDEDDS